MAVVATIKYAFVQLPLSNIVSLVARPPIVACIAQRAPNRYRRLADAILRDAVLFCTS